MARLIQSTVSAFVFLIATSVAAFADREAELERLNEILRLDELFEIMAEEGDLYAVDLEEQLFAGKGGDTWRKDVQEIYTSARLKDSFWQMFSEALSDQTVSETLAFYDSELGAKITDAELLTRRSFLDPAVEEAASEIVASMVREQDPFLVSLREYAKVNDLIDSNVVSSMNAQYAFMQGLIRGGAVDNSMTDSDILADIYNQEPVFRADTMAWVMSFLALAYQPLTESELRDHIAFGRTASGRQFNNALFSSFDEVFKDVSEALGYAAATYITSQDI
ncbi:DUF2059 domain-containing protein [Halocynthiibacter sp. C4]|uniref:DUF2059 domain-containing protein n=1 Tax=Halocynthiibacter sp. C4 TaxID=2992758 RepID=UPI00237C4CC9|nr:DUF2059 domain-containing protein [Halocynthiibacter sp. C4]MDE0589683.1 DUF2059 domain-containing protein [Halocynthiibacter sp. C4]